MVLSAAAYARKAAFLCAGVFAAASCFSSLACSFAGSAFCHLTHSSAKTTAALESEDVTFLGAAAFFDDLEADLAGDFCGTSSPFLPALALAAAFFVGVFLPFFGEDA